MLKHIMKSWYAHNSNYKEWEDKVLKYMNKEEFEDYRIMKLRCDKCEIKKYEIV